MQLHLYLSAFILASSFTLLTAQHRLDGIWEGKITVGGLASTETWPLEIFLKVEGEKIKGRVYVHKPSGEVIETDVSGWLYGDWSAYLKDVEFIPRPQEQNAPQYIRKYQLKYERSIWETTLDGYWQEITEDKTLSEKRELGRIQLQKSKRTSPKA